MEVIELAGQAVVVIGSKQWAVNVASTYAELTSGLSGVASIAANSGILFDMGVDQARIDVNMSQMLFSLDIIFINSASGVVGVLHDVQPGESASFQAANTLGARYFLEVNTGEAEGVEVGDSVSIQGQQGQEATQPAFWVGLMNVVLAVLVGISAYRELKGPTEPKLPKEPAK